MTIQVRLRAPRFIFAGETAVAVLAGTTGTVEALTIGKYPKTTAGFCVAHAGTLTIWWDAVLVQEAANDEPTTYSGWQDSGVPIASVEYLGVLDQGSDLKS